VKEGHHTLGVQRQYTGTAGRIENTQVAMAWARADAAAASSLLPPHRHKARYVTARNR
jgi:SRSO17 transposase